MANAKFIDAATWASLPEIDVTNGEDLFPQLAAGTYRPVLSGVDSAVIPALTAGAIVQATPTVGDTLTVSGSNATGSATFQWQRDTGGGQADISGATSATYDTTGQPEGDYRRGVSDGVQGPVYTAAVTLGAAATVPGTMSAPTVTAVSSSEISVDRAAAPSDGGSAITSYDLRHSIDQSTWTTATGIADPQTVSGLSASTLYYAQTRAVNAVGAGAWSASGSATTQAASGVDFNEQWAGYTLGEPLQTEGPYERLSGAFNVTTEDRSGTRVATMLDNTDLIYRYTGTAPTSNRSLTAVIHQKSDLAGSYVSFYLSYIDASNHIEAQVGNDGWINLRYVVGGTGVFSTASFNVGAGAGDTIKLTLSGTTLTLHRNGGLLSTKTSVPTTPIANHGFRIRATAAQTTRWEISRLHIEDL